MTEDTGGEIVFTVLDLTHHVSVDLGLEHEILLLMDHVLRPTPACWRSLPEVVAWTVPIVLCTCLSDNGQRSPV